MRMLKNSSVSRKFPEINQTFYYENHCYAKNSPNFQLHVSQFLHNSIHFSFFFGSASIILIDLQQIAQQKCSRVLARNFIRGTAPLAATFFAQACPKAQLQRNSDFRDFGKSSFVESADETTLLNLSLFLRVYFYLKVISIFHLLVKYI